MSQKNKVREVLQCGLTITPLEALTWYGCLRLGARIKELRKEGMNIVTTMIKVSSGKRVARYHLIREEAKGELFLDGVREAL